MDEELKKLNHGIFPKEYQHKMQLAQVVMQSVIKKPSVCFFTNTNYFSKEMLQEARRERFRIIQLVAPRDIMESRNQRRVQYEGYDDLSRHFNSMVSYQKEIVQNDLVDRVINTSQSKSSVVNEFLTCVQLPS